MRGFLAVPVEQPTLGAVADLLTSLRPDVPSVRWARPAGLHITLHFFGAIDPEEAAAVVAKLGSDPDRFTTFVVRLSHTGGFPGVRHPRVLWLGVDEGRTELEALAAICREVVTARGRATDDRPFRPHCTVGRVGSRWSATAADRWTSATSLAAALPAFTASRLALFESRPDGAYVVRDEVSFTSR